MGSGNWGSAISMLVGANAKSNPGQFAEEVRMWVFEEEVDGQKLSEIINTKHENVKYLKGKKLPENVKAGTDKMHKILEFKPNRKSLIQCLTWLRPPPTPTSSSL